MDNRPETGPMRFGDTDWTGVFIRGDSAFGYRMLLEQVLAQTNTQNPILVAQVRGLIDLLNTCHEPVQPEGETVQVLRSYPECLPSK